MLLDANTLPQDARLHADICIVGAGAAGIAMALSLADSGLDVIVLEAGGQEPEPRTQALYEGTVEDAALHSPLDRYRQRELGGSTTIWGGRCMPLDPIDFEARPYIAGSGWPIGAEDLAPYYPAANAWCEAGDYAYTMAEAFAGPRRPMLDGFDESHFSTHTLERFSCPTNFGGRYLQRLRTAPDLRVVLHANVTRLELDEAGEAIRRVEFKTLDGKTFAVSADSVVLAAGGLEVVRLLLNSPGRTGRGLGNAHDVVGRYYMCHLAGTIGNLVLAPPHRAWHGYDVADDGTYCRRRLALRPGVQREQGIGNFVARLHHPRITDPAHGTAILSLLFLARAFVPYEYAKRLHGDERVTVGAWLRHGVNVLRGAPSVVGFLWHWLRDRTLAARKFPSIIVYPRTERYSLDFHAEQEPNRESRVSLGASVDELGMRRLHVDWRYTRQDVATVQKSLALLAADVRDSGIGEFDYDPGVVEREMTRYGAYGGHHIGTARMGDDPRTSVVDRNCRVHEVRNLYVAGAAVFPTSSQANPTLTLVALALRLARHLQVRHAGGEPADPGSPA
ncbi:GMC family oxidoreductase [Pigmentiphaga sp. H8]|uniref:FAD-dependent oxidoreductase n=1 Tax=Pigmentiphaga sp. H8 TaxID=2488560 RepID=UPI000F5A4978|nr:GMC family oxidoreductase [Pigmentiphaga sp. H8]AZG09792.1 GMC family oxidoreductase [Pigmentiphaga sp. H8]